MKNNSQQRRAKALSGRKNVYWEPYIPLTIGDIRRFVLLCKKWKQNPEDVLAALVVNAEDIKPQMAMPKRLGHHLFLALRDRRTGETIDFKNPALEYDQLYAAEVEVVKQQRPPFRLRLSTESESSSSDEARAV